MYTETINHNEDQRTSAANHVAQNQSNQYQAKTLEDNRSSVFALPTLQRSSDSEEQSNFDSNYAKFKENWVSTKNGKLKTFESNPQVALKWAAGMRRMLKLLTELAAANGNDEAFGEITGFSEQLENSPSFISARNLRGEGLYDQALDLLKDSNSTIANNTYEWLNSDGHQPQIFVPTLQGAEDSGSGIVSSDESNDKIEFEEIHSSEKTNVSVRKEGLSQNGRIIIYLKLNTTADKLARTLIHEAQHEMDKFRTKSDSTVKNDGEKSAQLAYQQTKTELRAFIYAMEDLGGGRRDEPGNLVAEDYWNEIKEYQIGLDEHYGNIRTTSVLGYIFQDYLMRGSGYKAIQDAWIENNIVPDTGKRFRESVAEYMSTSDTELLPEKTEADLLNNQARDGANPFNSIRLDNFYYFTKEGAKKKSPEEAIERLEAQNLTLEEMKFLSISPWWNNFLGKGVKKTAKFLEKLNSLITEREEIEAYVDELEEEEELQNFIDELEEEEEEGEEFEEDEEEEEFLKKLEEEGVFEEELSHSNEPNPGPRIVTRNDPLMELLGRTSPPVTYQNLASEVEKLKNDIIRTKAEAGPTLQEHQRDHFRAEYDKLNKRLEELKFQNRRLNYQENSRTRSELTIKIEEVDLLQANLAQIFLVKFSTPGSVRTFARLREQGRAFSSGQRNRKQEPSRMPYPHVIRPRS